ncbi:CgeB family protein [Gilvimarinus sp. F26214L]|uniref:CgeB family protein n=1 Tax=Gilvimarinus sp. DZF01 TaxID=3461371 RepID=UPI0040460D8E
MPSAEAQLAPLDIAFFGSSLLSSYWNGAATYYRGIIKALAERGHRVTFYEPDAFERQQHRDMDPPDWARVVVYEADEESAARALRQAKGADIVVKASGVGVLDEWLEREVLRLREGTGTRVIFWDVDAPATLSRVHNDPNDPFRALIGQYDFILTYGGGDPVVRAYRELGARACHPIYNALDPDTHFPVDPDPGFQATLGFLGNRLPDREARVHEFFFKAVAALPGSTFLLGGSGWEQHAPQFPNLRYLGHVYTRDHNVFNCSPLAVLNINRDSMAQTGFSPPTRVFEAAGAGACLIMDRWQGAELFLEPGTEVLLASSGDEVVAHLQELTPERSRAIGEAARRRVLAEHTYRHRALQFEELMSQGTKARKTA